MQDEIARRMYWFNHYRERDITKISDDELYTGRYDTQFIVNHLSWCDEQYKSIVEFYNRLNAECYERDIAAGIITREKGYSG